jgi:hypothetical protein
MLRQVELPAQVASVTRYLCVRVCTAEVYAYRTCDVSRDSKFHGAMSSLLDPDSQFVLVW